MSYLSLYSKTGENSVEQKGLLTPTDTLSNPTTQESVLCPTGSLLSSRPITWNENKSTGQDKSALIYADFYFHYPDRWEKPKINSEGSSSSNTKDEYLWCIADVFQQMDSCCVVCMPVFKISTPHYRYIVIKSINTWWGELSWSWSVRG